MNNSVKFVRKRENAVVPVRATSGSAAVDLCACVEDEIVLSAGESLLVPTGIAIELPSSDMAAFIFARSGLSTKFGIALANGVGVVDSDYRGEICVALRNFSSEDYIVKKNERIAQMVIMPVLALPFMEVSSLSDTARGEGGFGSTGR